MNIIELHDKLVHRERVYRKLSTIYTWQQYELAYRKYEEGITVLANKVVHRYSRGAR